MTQVGCRSNKRQQAAEGTALQTDIINTRLARNVSFTFRIVRSERVLNVPEIASYVFRATLIYT